MPVAVKAPPPLSEDEFTAGLVLLDPLLFRLHFFASDLTEEMSVEQKLMMLDESDNVFLCTARKVAKTVHLEATILQTGLTTFGDGVQEALCFTPADVHLGQIMDRVYARLEEPTVKLFVRAKQQGDKAQITFIGGLRWYFRIEGLSGKDTNMVGLRAVFIVGDEMAFGNWVCHNSRIQTALPACRFIYAGVPNGVRGTPFYVIDHAVDNKWSRHKMSTYANPLYRSPERKAKLIEQYDGEDTQGYKNNVLGLWGEEVVSIFPPGSLAFHDQPYYQVTLDSFSSELELKEMLPQRLVIPPKPCLGFALGWDYGLSVDPSVVIGAILVDLKPQVAIEHEKGHRVVVPGHERWQTYFRLTLKRVTIPHQVYILRWIMHHIFLGPFMGLSTDKQEAVQLLQQGTPQAPVDPEQAKLFFFANPGGQMQIPITETVPLPQGGTETVTKITTVGMKEHQTESLADWMSNAILGAPGVQLLLSAQDTELANELTGTTAQRTRAGRTIYFPPAAGTTFGKVGADHNTDASRYLTDAIERGQKLRQVALDDSSLTSVMGWVGGSAPRSDEARGWNAPWGRRSQTNR